MAEGALVNIISKVVSTMTSPSLKKAYERNTSVWEAREELEKTRESMEAIQGVIVDADKKQGSSPEVAIWIKKVREVMYDAEDLVDEIATDEMIRMQTKTKVGSLRKKVQVSLSKLNPILNSNDLSARVKSLRKRLTQLSEEAAEFEPTPQEGPTRKRAESRSTWSSYVDANVVVGREEDRQAIVGLLLDDADEPRVCVVALVGVTGQGKTTLANLVYNTEEVRNHFDTRVWASASDTADHKQLTAKISQAVVMNAKYPSVEVLESSMKGSVRGGGRFLLVLDELWMEDHERVQLLRSLLRSSDGAKGSRVIITTRSLEVAKAMEADHTYHVNALSLEASWELFKRIAFTREQENDTIWHSLGKNILMKCAYSPLATRTVASLLYTTAAKEEWRSISDRLGECSAEDHSIWPTLRLSYDYLPPTLKQCFAYCSLFPKDYAFSKEQLIRLWIAQGFVTTHHHATTVESVGESIFMDLLMRSFFQGEKEDENGEISSCKMHDLFHDLALDVAREECVMLTRTGGTSLETIRHLSMADDSCETLPSLLDANQSLRSFIFINGGSLMPQALGKLTSQKFLRAVDLQRLNMKEVPSSIGELKLLRYLNLSGNNFTHLPESITRLVNLATLDASSCAHLEHLPTDFRKLISLRHLSIQGCDALRYMPVGLEELTSLQYLSDFKVGKGCGGVDSSTLESLAGLQLQGKLEITFDDRVDKWAEDERWQLPPTLQVLEIRNYPCVRIPPQSFQGKSDGPSLLHKLARLKLHNSPTIKHLPPLRCFPHLKALHLSSLLQLEYIEDEEEQHGQSAQLMLSLEDLTLTELPKLVAWSMKVEATTSSKGSTDLQRDGQVPSFPLLSTLTVGECPMLKSLPLSSRLRTVNLKLIREELIHQVLSLSSHSLETMRISHCDSLNSFGEGNLTSLQRLELTNCENLNHFHLPLLQLNVLEQLVIRGCPELKLWREAQGADWDSLTSLRLLSLDEIPDVEMLPSSLRQSQSKGKLEIRGSS